jgi:SAM-dependent methyltransferase
MTETGASFWSKIAQGRESTHAGVFVPVWTGTLDLLGVGAGTTFLDAGCGTGMATAIAVERGARAYGADAADNMVKLAAQRVPQAEFSLCDMETMPFADGFFDRVMAVNSLHFTNRPMRALRELVRVCAAGGKVAVVSLGPREDHNFEAPMKALLAKVPPERKKDPGIVDPFRLAATGVVDMMFEEVGLTDLQDRLIECPISHDSLEHTLAAMRNVGLYAAASMVVATDVLDAALTEALRPFVQTDGRVVWRATHRVVMGTKPAY